MTSLTNNLPIPAAPEQNKLGAAPSPGQSMAQLEKAAKDFESYFVSQIFNSAYEGMPQSEFSGGGNEQSIFQSMFIDEVSKMGAEKGHGMGLAEAMLKQVNGYEAMKKEVGLSLKQPAPSVAAGGQALQLPVTPDAITSRFGLRKDPMTGESRHHDGVDVALPMRTPLKAAGEGTVTFSGPKGGYGNAVEILHPNGVSTLYAHNDENCVTEGQKVAQGQVIGFSGNSGRSTGPHLHLEVKSGEKAVDPEKYVKFDNII